MTLIKRITAHGFKSFANHTELIFGDKFNCIIGPNGSGKSNCADALCFVLGKSSAKGMRAEKTANLIYNGGKTGRPSKEAEVTIEFDNKNKTFPIDSETIKVTRVAKNNGTSIYRINNELRTRQQVVDILNAAKLDSDGHNIILQGDIVGFIEMKPIEKRVLIEEVAGISMYEDKKTKCLSELEKVDARLGEASIILTEREANLRELKKERDQAIKYKEIQQLMQENNATLIYLQIKDKEQQVEQIEKKYKDANEKIEKVNTEILKIREQITQWKNEIKQINQEIEIRGAQEQLALRKEIETIKEDIIKANSRLETCQTEIQKINARKQQLDVELRDTENKIVDLQKEQIRTSSKLKESEILEQDIKKEINKLKLTTGIDENAANNLEKIEIEIEKNQKDISTILEQKQIILRAKDQLSFKINAIVEKLNKTEKKEDIPEIKELMAKKEHFKLIADSLNKVLNENSGFAAQLYKLRQEYQDKSEELSKLHAKNAGIQEKISGDVATKEILKLKSKIEGIHGTVAELGKVNRQYSLALEIAAGPRIFSIVVDNDQIAQQCIQYLRENKFGVVTFLPLNKIKPREISDEAKQILKAKKSHGLAINLVDFEPQYKNIFMHAFGETIIVDNIQKSREIGIGKVRMVTLEGDLVEPSGAMIGGYRQQKRAAGFKEKELDSSIEILESEILKQQQIIQKIEEEKAENENSISRLREEKANTEGAIIRIEKSIHLPENELKALEAELNSYTEQLAKEDEKIIELENSINIINKTIDSYKEKRNKIKETLSNQEIMQNLISLEQDGIKAHEKVLETKSEIKHLEMQLDNILLQDKEKTQKILKEQEKDHENFTAEIRQLIKTLEEKREILKNKEKEEEKFHSNIKDLISKREQTTEKIQLRENEITREEERNKNNQSNANDVSIERAKTIAELEGLQKQFEPFKETKIKRGLSIEQLKEKIMQSQRELESMGGINMRAFEVYETIEKELIVLIEKSNKLKLEKEDIIKLMLEIESQKKDIFMKTYNAVVSRFKSIFLSLSTKGEAQVFLENAENPFEGGIEIEIKISGNKYLDIKGLSGGEKTMAALAFIFAIQEYSPSPFYLLDEVDATLDRTNSALLSRLIRKYSDKAQYIVITHNDGIINDADLIYGVSMKDGISKVIGLKI